MPRRAVGKRLVESVPDRSRAAELPSTSLDGTGGPIEVTLTANIAVNVT